MTPVGYQPPKPLWELMGLPNKPLLGGWGAITVYQEIDIMCIRVLSVCPHGEEIGCFVSDEAIYLFKGNLDDVIRDTLERSCNLKHVVPGPYVPDPSASQVYEPPPYIGSYITESQWKVWLPSPIPKELTLAGPTPAQEVSEIVPALTRHIVPCPREGSCGKNNLQLDRAIIHLNDSHEWSREKIADWLDSLDIDLTIQPKSKGD
jgi:hypothetical protein